MEKLLKEIDSHILEASRAGYTSCAYEADSSVELREIKQAQRSLLADGHRVTRNQRILTIDWSQP